MDVATGPIVPFRSREILKEANDPNAQGAPLFWLHNVKSMRVEWPAASRKEKYVEVSERATRLLVSNKNCVLVRRFSTKDEKRRLIAAPWIASTHQSSHIGIENHLNDIHRKGGQLSEIEALGIAAILNGSLLDDYFRIFNGNTQVSATELRSMPLPDRPIIEGLGSIALRLLNWRQPLFI